MIIFIVPAYNEAGNISALLNTTDEKMREEGLSYKMIIINDGSTDNTVTLVEHFKNKMPVDICSYYPNKGTGEAFRTGFRLALSGASDDDIIVTKEADNTSDLGILKDMVKKINEGYDVVLASCYAKEGAVKGANIIRLILSRLANALLKLFFPIQGVNTYSSFYRAYKVAPLKRLYERYGDRLIQENGFVCMTELLIKLNKWGKLKIVEVPMVLNVDKRMGNSKMKVMKTIFGYLKIILRQKLFSK